MSLPGLYPKPTPRVNLDGNLGAALLGLVAGSMLYGVTCVQTFMYCRRSRRNDSWKLTTMVGYLWLADSINTACTIYGVYFYLVTSFGNYEVLLRPSWAVIAQVFLTNLSNIVVRCFFARRVHILSGPGRQFLGIVLPTIIIFIACCIFVTGVGFAASAFRLKTFERLSEASWMLYTSFGCAVVDDFIIAFSLCAFLIESRSGLPRSDSLITFLMAFTINTGLLTSIAAVVCLVSYAVAPQLWIFMGVYFIISKLYTNSLLASLNARDALRQGFSGSALPGQTNLSFPISLDETTRQITNVKDLQSRSHNVEYGIAV